MPYEPKALKSFFGYKTQLHTVGDKHWICLVMNDPNGQYGFKKDRFTIETQTMAGYISESGEHWLLATVTDKTFTSEGVFELEIKKPGDKTNEKTGKAQYVLDTEATDAIKKAWSESGNLMALKCDDIPYLKQLVYALHHTKYITNNPVTVYIREIPKGGEETIQNDLIECLDRLATGNQPNNLDPLYQKMVVLSQLGILTIPFKDVSELPQVQLKDIFGNVTETKTLVVPFEGTLPKYTSISFTPPQAPDKKGYGGYGTNVNTVYTPEERLTWVCNALKSSGVPIENDTILSLYTAIHSSDMYDTFYRMALQLSGVPIDVHNNHVTIKEVTPIPLRTVEPSNKGTVSNLPGINDYKIPPMLNSNGNGSVTSVTNGSTVPPFDSLDSKMQTYQKLIEEQSIHVDPTTLKKRTEKELEYLITILNSRTFKEQKANLIAWIITNVGMNTNIQTFKEGELAKVHEAVTHNDTLLDINPGQDVATLVLAS